MSSWNAAADSRLAASVQSLLRGEVPATSPPVEDVEACLRRYECGGYLYTTWSAAGRQGSLPGAWAEALRRAHRKTAIDSLAALGEFRRLGRALVEQSVRFILLKGGAYLYELYEDPGARGLTDIDILIRREDAGRLARHLMRAGYRGEIAVDFPWNRRFEMWRPADGACRFELHWGLGLPWSSAEIESLWERSVPGQLEGVPCRRLALRDALPYHAAHLAAHYFGPQLKWIIDLREMLRRWRPDLDLVADGCRAWRARTATSLALTHVARLFPGEVPPGWINRLAPGAFQRALYGLYRSENPLELFGVSNDSRWRFALRPLTMDGPGDALRLVLRASLRGLLRSARVRGLSGGVEPPWAWSD
ncbi:MAG: nucleotidyltransferase family protein [Acidobacteria bacterium]|nr:nucleotidyltransferase family protein [Acidobacteriota bacterium]